MKENGVKIDVSIRNPNEELESLVRKWAGHPFSRRLAKLLRADHLRYSFIDSNKFDEIRKKAKQNPTNE